MSFSCDKLLSDFLPPLLVEARILMVFVIQTTFQPDFTKNAKAAMKFQQQIKMEWLVKWQLLTVTTSRDLASLAHIHAAWISWVLFVQWLWVLNYMSQKVFHQIRYKSSEQTNSFVVFWGRKGNTSKSLHGRGYRLSEEPFMQLLVPVASCETSLSRTAWDGH